MLDDLKLIHQRDAQDFLGVAEKQWQQLLFRYEVKLPKDQPIDNIVWAGMGKSAIPAILSQSWLGCKKPLEICQSYEIPEYVSKNTLFIAASYLGDCEETLEALTCAEKKSALIVVLTSGGQLAQRAKAANHPLYDIPSGVAPCMANLFFVKALADVYEQLGLGEGLSEQLEVAADGLKQTTLSWRPDIATKSNLTKQLALELIGKSVAIYSGPKMQAVANYLKIAINDNAKQVAWWSVLPEANHSELAGWSSQPLDKPYGVVDIRSNLEHPKVQRRFETTERLLSGKRPAPHIIEPTGETILQQLLWGLAFSDFVSIYLAILNGLNPASTELAEKFKAELNK